MAIEIKKNGLIVRKFLDNPLYKDTPSLTLAKIIFDEYKFDFNNIDSVRTIVRYNRGQLGSYNKSKLSTNKYLKSTGHLAPYKIPNPESEDYLPLILEEKYNNIGVIGDFHFPNHRKKPIELAYSYFKEKKINTLILNGDLLDNTPFTNHDCTRPTADDVRRWFEQVESFLEYTRDYFPKAKIIWAEGNHDYWFKRWLHSHAWQLSKDPYFTLEERLHISEYNIEFLKQTRYIMAGGLAIVHGHHMVKGIIAPVNSARGVFNKAKASVLINHVHIESSHTETNLHGDMITCWSLGCMCTLTPDYMPMAGKACHGFAHVTTNKKLFHVDNFRIKNGKIL